jgi:hypothetical protein
MIFATKRGESFDTEKDLSAAERHILQKLFLWKDLASSVEDFRSKKQKALFKGWNDSGPIPESSAMKSITSDLEKQVSLRLRLEKKSEAVSGEPLPSPPNAHSFRYTVMKNDKHEGF